MLTKKVEAALLNQIEKEGFSSQLYLAMASWAEMKGFTGCATFLFAQAEEERIHMLKIIHYTNDRRGHAKISNLNEPTNTYANLNELFQLLLEHELSISKSINDLVGICVDEKDFTTQNFLQWYVNEQIEEEKNAQTILDKLEMLGNDPARHYLFDNFMETFAAQLAAAAAKNAKA